MTQRARSHGEPPHGIRSRAPRNRRIRWNSYAQPSRSDERRRAGDGRWADEGDRRSTKFEAWPPLPRDDGTGSQLLRRRESATRIDRRRGSRDDARSAFPSLFAPTARSTLSDRHRRQWRRRWRRDELRADGRSDSLRAIRLFFASLSPYRAGPRWRIDVAAAAPDRQGARH